MTQANMYTVSLELPECEGANPVEAVEDYQAQSEQQHLFVYRVTHDRTCETYLVDMSDESVTAQSDGVAPYVRQEVTPTIEFADSSGAAAVRGIAAYAEFTVDLDLTNDGYPHERVMIVRVDEDQNVVVCETEEDGTPIRNSTWAIPLEVIKKVTVL